MKFQSKLKAIAKALAPLPNRGLRAAPITLRSLVSAAWISLLMAGLSPANAGEPCHWERKPNKPEPFQFDTYHGETIDFRCTFVGFSSLPFGQSSNPQIPQSSNPPRLYYQTNGMASAWWDIPATVSTTVVTNCHPPITNYSLSAVFPPAADPGAERLTVFFGAPSNAYAAAQVRFRNSPGPFPNTLPPPSILDWHAELSSATNSLMASLTSATNSLAKSLAPTITNTVTKAYVEDLGIESGVDAQTATNMTALTPVYSQTPTYGWLCNPADIDGYPITIVWNDEGQGWQPVANGTIRGVAEGALYETLLWWQAQGDWDGDEDLTATRVRTDIIGYTLGSQTNSVLAAASITNTILKSLAPMITNTVTKSYVESLGIESGVDAQTVTNIANSATNFLTRAEAIAGYTEWTFSNISDGIKDISQPEIIGESEPIWWCRFFYSDGYRVCSIYNPDPSATNLLFTFADEGLNLHFTATRHRITPTALSQLTNDVGYVTETITNSLASTNYVDSATNSLAKSLATTITNLYHLVSILTNQLDGIDNVLHVINTGTNLVQNGGN